MSQGGNPPQPRSGMRPATAGGAARPRVGPAQLRLQGCGKRPLGCEESGEVSAQCGLLKLSFLVTNKEREMFVSKRGWERAEPAGFCRKDGCSEVGMWCSAPGPAATTDFICSLYHSGRHNFPGNSGNCQANGLWSIPAPTPPLPLAAPHDTHRPNSSCKIFQR